MTLIKTSPKLLERIQQAATSDLSPEDLHAQRVSFAMGAVSSKGTITRDQVERIVSKQQGKSAA